MTTSKTYTTTLTFPNKCWHQALLLALWVSALPPRLMLAAEDPRLVVDRIEWTGSQRLPADFLEQEFGLTSGALVREGDLTEVRTRLLGTGLFRSVQFFLHKGQSPGHVQLRIELEDDPSVLGSWALGSSLSLTQGQRAGGSLGNELSPLGFKAQLISRNLFGAMHRAAGYLDYDGQGILRGFQLAYGFPRFSAEDVQFDAQMEALDPAWRYFEVLGFASKGEIYWTFTNTALGTLQYGVSLYSNQDRRMSLHGFPKTVLGPKLGLHKETRLLSFRTSEGYSYAAAAIITTEGTRAMSYELEGAWTLDLSEGGSGTIQSQLFSVGLRSFSARQTMRWEQALTIWDDETDPLFYLQATHAYDRYRDLRYQGNELRVGLRFHSSGLIADIAFMLTQLPERFTPGSQQEVSR